jgi:hypothetical protein
LNVALWGKQPNAGVVKPALTKGEIETVNSSTSFALQ